MLRPALALALALAALHPHAARAQAATAAPTAEATPAADAPPAAKPERRPFRLGVTNAWWVGFTGPLSNPVPAYTVALDVGFPTGRNARYHLEVGFENVNGWDGLRLSPLNIGYAIPVPEPLRDVRVEVELILELLHAEVLFDDRFSVALSSGFRAQVVVGYGPGFVAFAPLGFEIRYAYGVGETGIETGAGADWPFVLTIGAEL